MWNDYYDDNFFFISLWYKLDFWQSQYKNNKLVFKAKFHIILDMNPSSCKLPFLSGMWLPRFEHTSFNANNIEGGNVANIIHILPSFISKSDKPGTTIFYSWMNLMHWHVLRYKWAGLKPMALNLEVKSSNHSVARVSGVINHKKVVICLI